MKPKLEPDPKPSAVGVARARQAAISAGVALAFLAPAALMADRFGPSAYLLGTAAALIAAGRSGAVGASVVTVVVCAAGLTIDRRAGISITDAITRALLFAAIAMGVGGWAQALRLHKRRSAYALKDAAHKAAVIRSILDTGPDAILVIDDTGKVSSFSLAAETLFGWRADEVIGRNVNMLMPNPYHDEHDGYIARYIQSGERRVIGKSREVTGLRKDGSHFPMVLYVGEVNVGGERRFTGFVHDLTALNEAHDRTQQLRNQLAHVWRMNSLGEMAAMLAHELNQPLTAISNYVQGARSIVSRMELKDDDLLDALHETGAQAIRAGEIIRRTRSMLAREAVDRQQTSLSDLISEIDLMIGLIAREASVSVSYDLAKGDDVLELDRVQIQQVVGNLVRNAVDAMKGSRTRQLKITTEMTGQSWIVKVEDSGPGVVPEAANELFSPLFTTKQGGMGLGLSISRTIIEHHSGEIWVERSRLGGAAFCFSLPAKG